MSVNASDATRRVLLVDDSEDACELFKEVLEMEGHVVETANDGARALVLLATMPFDIAVVDIGLPDIDGYEVARKARAAAGPARPVFVALTGFSGPADRERAKEAGFDVHLVKPVDPSLLIETIAKAERR